MEQSPLELKGASSLHRTVFTAGLLREGLGGTPQHPRSDSPQFWVTLERPARQIFGPLTCAYL